MTKDKERKWKVKGEGETGRIFFLTISQDDYVKSAGQAMKKRKAVTDYELGANEDEPQAAAIAQDSLLELALGPAWFGKSAKAEANKKQTTPVDKRNPKEKVITNTVGVSTKAQKCKNSCETACLQCTQQIEALEHEDLCLTVRSSTHVAK